MRGVSRAPRPRGSHISAGRKTATKSSCPISIPRLKPTSPHTSAAPLGRARQGGKPHAMHKAETEAPEPSPPIWLGRENIFRRKTALVSTAD
jgi:hypothetical protein